MARRKLKVEKFIESTEEETVVSTGFKVKASILEDFKVARDEFKKVTGKRYNTREALEAMLEDTTEALNILIEEYKEKENQGNLLDD